MTTASPADSLELGRRHVLAVDLGTGGPKVGIVSLSGELRWCGQLPVPTERSQHGVAVQDAALWWELILELATQGLGSGAVDPHSVEAVAVTGQWGSTVPVDAGGIPVGPCRLFLDTRGAPHAHKLIGGAMAGYHPTRALKWLRTTAGAPSPNGGDPVAHMLSLSRDDPEVTARARWFLEPVDYVTMRFTGRAVASPNSMTGAWLTDNRDLGHAAYDMGLVALSGVSEAHLPPLVASGSLVGEVLPEVCRVLGLRAGVVAVAGVTDLLSATIGSGAVCDDQAHFAISTTSWISAPMATKKTDILHSIATVPGLWPDRYLVANNHETSGLCLAWAQELWGGSFDDLTALASTAPAGSGRVLFTPWLAGLRSPEDDRRARGGWHNLSVTTTKADLVRAVLEGVTFNNRWLLEQVDRFVGRRIETLRVIGGGALSDFWCQLHADMTGRQIERVTEPMTAQLRGAALIAGVALGALTREDIAESVVVERTFTPDAGASTAYGPIYQEFRRLYRQQKGMFARLNG
ncbi:MAG: FGGY-family carbohydrate kinase [Actinomycetales bacterium]|nr:FGGY-family carbohydrate kinase [Actinomycetales bacterium]